MSQKCHKQTSAASLVYLVGQAEAGRESNGFANVLRRYGNLIKLDVERTERVRDSVCKRGGRPNRATFADTFNAERIERRW